MKLNDFTFICMCRTGLDNSEAANIFGLKVVWVGSIDCRTTRRRSYIEGEEVVLDLWWWGWKNDERGGCFRIEKR